MRQRENKIFREREREKIEREREKERNKLVQFDIHNIRTCKYNARMNSEKLNGRFVFVDLF